jgi:hypothetical protein
MCWLAPANFIHFRHCISCRNPDWQKNDATHEDSARPPQIISGVTQYFLFIFLGSITTELSGGAFSVRSNDWLSFSNQFTLSIY